MLLKTKSQINILGKVYSTIVELVLLIIICCMLCSNNALASSITIMPSQGPSETVIPQVDDPLSIILILIIKIYLKTMLLKIQK